MTDLDFALDRLRRMTLIEWSHGLIGCATLAAWALFAFGGPV